MFYSNPHFDFGESEDEEKEKFSHFLKNPNKENSRTEQYLTEENHHL